MDLALDVLVVYAAFAVWIGLVLRGFRKGAWTTPLVFGIAFAVALNVRYFIDGAPDAIASFVGIYDVTDNLGVAPGETHGALAPCPDNVCSVWGERYETHPSWGVAFHDRFANGPELRRTLLYGHLLFNSIVFVLMHVQLAKPGGGANRRLHSVLGRTSFLCITLGTACAVWLAAEHGPVTEYGGPLSMFGFWFMSLCVYSCAVMGVVSIRRGDAALHRVWMVRFIGSMWGAFWLFRIMLLATGPLMRDWEAASILTSIWFSAPLGILIAEVIRRRRDARRQRDTAPMAPPAPAFGAGAGRA